MGHIRRILCTRTVRHPLVLTGRSIVLVIQIQLVQFCQSWLIRQPHVGLSRTQSTVVGVSLLYQLLQLMNSLVTKGISMA